MSNNNIQYKLFRIVLQLLTILASCCTAILFSTIYSSHSLHPAEIGIIYFLFNLLSIFTLVPYADFYYKIGDKEDNSILLHIGLLGSLFFFQGTSYWAILLQMEKPVWHWIICWFLFGGIHIGILMIILTTDTVVHKS
jgi:MFS family permease